MKRRIVYLAVFRGFFFCCVLLQLLIQFEWKWIREDCSFCVFCLNVLSLEETRLTRRERLCIGMSTVEYRGNSVSWFEYAPYKRSDYTDYRSSGWLIEYRFADMIAHVEVRNNGTEFSQLCLTSPLSSALFARFHIQIIFRVYDVLIECSFIFVFVGFAYFLFKNTVQYIFVKLTVSICTFILWRENRFFLSQAHKHVPTEMIKAKIMNDY